jgi:hypothetical protein
VTKQTKRKLTPDETYVRLFNGMMDTSAWLAMSLGARCLYIEIKRQCRTDNGNNGKLFLSQRDAQKALGTSNRRFIARWYRELQHYGFIVLTRRGFFGVGNRMAAQWRLTELPCNDEPPTRDYKRWNGTPFSDPRKIKSGTPVGTIRNDASGTRVGTRSHNSGTPVGTIRRHNSGTPVSTTSRPSSTHATGGSAPQRQPKQWQ